MEEPADNQNPYIAPRAGDTTPPAGATLSVPVRCLLWAATAPLLLACAAALLDLTPVKLIAGSLVFIFAPPFLILWQEFKRGGLRSVSTGRFCLITLLALVSAASAAVVYAIFMVVGEAAWGYVRYRI